MLHSNGDSNDRHHRLLHFICGSVVGGACAFLTIRPGMEELLPHLLRTLLIALLCGFLAARYGDRAWRWLSRVLPWT